MPIPLVDLKAQYRAIKPEIDAAMASVVEAAAFINGPVNTVFERAFAAFCEAPGCVGVGNGTDALSLALRALDLGPGDEVITVAHTFIATAEAIVSTGATPVFVDVDPDTLLMDPDAVATAVTPATRAIVPVHLYGQPCDMDRLLAIAARHGLRVVEDAAQAHGARWKGRRVGTFGDAGCFSFFPGKNLGAYGDAGGVASSDAALLDRVRRLANHGRDQKHLHLETGVNSRLDSLQAAVLNAKLPHLDDWNAARRRIAARYMDGLRGHSGIRLPQVRPDAETVWHLFVVQVEDRARVQADLKAQGIDTGIHYPVPLHRQPAFAGAVAERALPVTEAAAGRIMSLPIYPELQDDEVDHIVRALRAAVPGDVVPVAAS